MIHPDGSVVHLAYCTNVHPAEDVDGVIGQLERFAAPVREELGTERLGVGLWLAAPAAAELVGDDAAVERLRAALERLGLEAVTFNGFPYQGFHDEVVKQRVYVPDWTTAERREFTVALARILTRLLPEDVTDGSVSTLPLAWREGFGADEARAARVELEATVEALRRLAEETGKRVRVAVEPEPGCAIETVAGLVEGIAGLDEEVVGICLDACHSAVQFESPADALARLSAAGVPIVKMQASAALRVEPARIGELADFVEPRFLHQTRTLENAAVLGVDDLDQALDGGLPREEEWRVHFHVPVHLDEGRTTQPQLRQLLEGVLGGEHALTHHVELETYTWNVMPGDLRPDADSALVDGLARELSWLTDELKTLGLKEAA
ncbi:MAG TPA: metabolite traffic protein EboE [Solirubrobacterales bacterium]|nr:metabolite traffic protein EboE [Solirubrobacterales bacterium]